MDKKIEKTEKNKAGVLSPYFPESGLVPAIAQDAVSGRVLMQAYMNEEAYRKTIETGFAHYYSRSRKKLWKKGEESGNVQAVTAVYLDCDRDCVLLKVRQTGPACHTGAVSCFFDRAKIFDDVPDASVLSDDAATIAEREKTPAAGSYTNYLLEKGLDKILKKVGEEASEVIIAAKNESPDELCAETADLLYHLQVLLHTKGLSLSDVYAVIRSRAEKERARNY